MAKHDNNISIRNAEAADIATLVTLWQKIDQASGHERPFGGDSIDKPDYAKQLLEQTLVSESACILVAVDNTGVIIGTVSGHVFDKPAVNISRVGVIYSLWVNAEHRCQGIGETLVNSLESTLKDKGAKAFQVGWDTGNDHAAIWWQKKRLFTLRSYCQ